MISRAGSSPPIELSRTSIVSNGSGGIMKAKWTSDDVPGQHGRLAVVTGANTGLGFETARVLAARGASVVLAVRDTEKGKAAAARIAGPAPGADVMVQPLDLASLDSIRAAAGALRARHPRIDLLINNAGVMRGGVRQQAGLDAAAEQVIGRLHGLHRQPARPPAPSPRRTARCHTRSGHLQLAGPPYHRLHSVLHAGWLALSLGSLAPGLVSRRHMFW